MKFFIVLLPLLLVACAPPQASPDAVSPPTEKPSPGASNVSPSSVTPMAKRVAGQEHVDPLKIFRAFGTEPFWNINVVDTTLTFTTPDDPAGMVMQGERHPVDGGLDIIGISRDGREFVLKVRAGACSDGMSDRHYDMTSRLQMGGSDYAGCGERAK